jgi:hypothetical protein
MSARKSVYAITDLACDGGESPNAYVAKITAEVRLHFPPNTVTRDEVFEALDLAVSDAYDKASDFFRERDK